VEIHRAIEPFRADGDPYPAGTDIIFMAQPFRAYAKTLLEPQRYPVVQRSPSDRPRGTTAWTLPAQMGVDVRTIERTFEPPPMSRLAAAQVAAASVWGERRPGHYVIDARGNAGAIAANRLVAANVSPSWIAAPLEANGFRYAAGSIVVAHSRNVEPVLGGIARDLGLRVDGVRGRPPASAKAIGRARVAVYTPWFENADEGWTRWVLDRYGFSYSTIADADVRASDLLAKYDVIVLPSASKERLTAGNSAESVPPEYAGGLGAAGIEALRAFVAGGGTLVCLDQASALAIDAFQLPLSDVGAGAKDRLYSPGSILRLDLEPEQALTFGMPPRTAAFFAFGSAYRPSGDAAGAIQTLARYGSADLLISGWLEGGETLAGQAAAVQAQVGAGRVLLFGFRVQHRAQSHATFRLLFNAVLSSPRTRP
jgi:hypothetical protein